MPSNLRPPARLRTISQLTKAAPTREIRVPPIARSGLGGSHVALLRDRRPPHSQLPNLANVARSGNPGASDYDETLRR